MPRGTFSNFVDNVATADSVAQKETAGQALLLAATCKLRHARRYKYQVFGKLQNLVLDISEILEAQKRIPIE